MPTQLSIRAKQRTFAGCPTNLGLGIVDDSCKFQARKSGNKIVQPQLPIAPPPGLESFVEATLAPRKPVGLVKPAGRSVKHCAEVPEIFQAFQMHSTQKPQVGKVEIKGLPNKLLSNEMLEAVIEQAGLSGDVFKFDFEVGAHCGQAWIYFKEGHEDAMEACVKHFDGCTWNASAKVSAHVVSKREMPAVPRRNSKESCSPLGTNMSFFAREPPWCVPDEPAFVHSSGLAGSITVNSMTAVKRACTKISTKKGSVKEKKGARMNVAMHHTASSDASTAVSDSETEAEEKVGPSKVLVHH